MRINAGKLRAVLVKLLDSDGHESDCQFRGCSCGRTELYKEARAEAHRVLRQENEKCICGHGAQFHLSGRCTITVCGCPAYSLAVEQMGII